MEFDHLDLAPEHRALIAKACRGSSRVRLRKLDKGLSGSVVWLGLWELASGVPSGPRVFKIGDRKKIEQEHEAIVHVVQAIDQYPAPVSMHYPDDRSEPDALLRLDFVGHEDEEPQSLRQFITDAADPREVTAAIHRLYFQRMRSWHVLSSPTRTSVVAMGDALDWWLTRMDLDGLRSTLGSAAADASLVARCEISYEDVVRTVDEVRRRKREIALGPVHGDLHAQNVLIDPDGDLHLIDFGWTAERWRAIDFLMLECSLKFLVSPAHAPLDDLLGVDARLGPPDDPRIDEIDFASLLYGNSLEKIARGVGVVRKAAFECGAVSDPYEYLDGLLLLTAGLSSLPTGINRAYLLHALGLHCRDYRGRAA